MLFALAVSSSWGVRHHARQHVNGRDEPKTYAVNDRSIARAERGAGYRRHTASCRRGQQLLDNIRTSDHSTTLQGRAGRLFGCAAFSRIRSRVFVFGCAPRGLEKAHEIRADPGWWGVPWARSLRPLLGPSRRDAPARIVIRWTTGLRDPEGLRSLGVREDRTRQPP